MTSPYPPYRWYSRPVLFVSDVQRSLRFYIESLGFKQDWPKGGEKWTVCQVSRSDCEIILCEEPRRDKSRLFIELTPEGLQQLRQELDGRAVPNKIVWWGYDCTQVEDPDGNELLFPEDK